MYYPNKPGKKHASFDCSAEFEEISINQELPFSPELTNQVVGVLTRFQQKAAFMADVEVMYYHVMVQDNQHAFLKLW